MVALVHKFQEYLEEKKVVTKLFIDIKRTFNHILKSQLIAKIMKIRVARDLIK